MPVPRAIAAVGCTAAGQLSRDVLPLTLLPSSVSCMQNTPEPFANLEPHIASINIIQTEAEPLCCDMCNRSGPRFATAAGPPGSNSSISEKQAAVSGRSNTAMASTTTATSNQQACLVRPLVVLFGDRWGQLRKHSNRHVWQCDGTASTASISGLPLLVDPVQVSAHTNTVHMAWSQVSKQ